MNTEHASPQVVVPILDRLPSRVALVGNPNAGKTALFNALTGLRAKTANYPGITVDVRKALLREGDLSLELMDLPGMYSLEAVTPEEQVTADVLAGRFASEPAPDAIVIVMDATNIERNLFFASEVLDLRRPTVVALNLMDAAEHEGISIDMSSLQQLLQCDVVPVSARTGEGLEDLKQRLAELICSQVSGNMDHVSCTAGCTGCTFAARYSWAQTVARHAVSTPPDHGKQTERIDRYLTDPIAGIVAFLAVMLGVFYLIFSLADVPMTLIEGLFAQTGGLVEGLIPPDAVHDSIWIATTFSATLATCALVCRFAGWRWSQFTLALACLVAVAVASLPVEDFRSLLVDGIISGVGGVMVFLPQICILFFFIALLEDSGYLARASFVMERIMRYVGLPGKAFVPMLSAHACAIPGIMSARVIEDWRDRLVTILVLPLLTCSARLPVYGMIAMLLFSDSKSMASLVFLGAYLLGISAALLTSLLLKFTLLRGETAPLVLELPAYRIPSLRNAIATVWDRAIGFTRNAGSVILLISVVLWALATYPKRDGDLVGSQAVTSEGRVQPGAEASISAPDSNGSAANSADVRIPAPQQQLAYSFAGRLGRAVEPVFRPLGFDWKINVGVISSFAAREVIVSTLAIIYGLGEESADAPSQLTDTLRSQTRADGTPVYTKATCFSLLVFYVLAMQCLPTQVVTRRETGSWKWALLQFGYMTLLAYVAALATYQLVSRLG